jgi:3-hydroxyacyl-[acyl-carrier-protein] dehydratase
MQLEYFQLLDRVTSLDLASKTIVTNACVPQTSTIFEGHFPGHPLMPGVLLIEAMAQTSGWLLLSITEFKSMPFLAAVKDAKLRNFVQPGQMLTINASVKHEGSGFAMTDAEIRVDGKLTSNATLTFRQIPFPNSDLRGHMDMVAERIGVPLPPVSHG